MQEIDGGSGAFQLVARNTRQTAALATDSYVEALIALFAQLGNGDIFADLHAGLDLHAYLAHNINLCLDDFLVEFIGRNTVSEHTAGLLVLLEDSGFVAHGSQIVRATQTRRTTADDGDFLFPALLHVGAYIDLWHKARFGVQVFLCNEFLDGVDSHRAVDSAACTSVLAPAVADSSADGRERVLAFDEFQCLGVFAFGGFLEVTLHGNMCGAGGFTRRCARGITVDTVLVAVVLSPFMRSPFGCVRQLLLGIGLRTALGA